MNDFHIFKLIRSRNGSCFFQDPEGQYWRLIEFIRDRKSYDIFNSPELAFERGKAFGIFQMLTSDIDAGSLFEILPNFHYIDFRLENFRKAITQNPVNRVIDIIPEISFVESRVPAMNTIRNLGKQGRTPLRVTHNDTIGLRFLTDHINGTVITKQGSPDIIFNVPGHNSGCWKTWKIISKRWRR